MSYFLLPLFYIYLFNIYWITTLLITILTFTRRKNRTTYINMTREKGKIQYYSTYSYLNLKMLNKLGY